MSTPIRIQVVLDGSQTQGQLGQIISGAFGSAGGRMSDMDQIFQRTWQNFGEMGAKVISGLQKQMAQMLESHVNNFSSAMNRISSASRGAAQGQFGPTNADRGALLRQSAFQYANQLDLQDYNRARQQEIADRNARDAAAMASLSRQFPYDAQRSSDAENHRRQDVLDRQQAQFRQLQAEANVRNARDAADMASLSRAFAYDADRIPRERQQQEDERRQQVLARQQGQYGEVVGGAYEKSVKEQAAYQKRIAELYKRMDRESDNMGAEVLALPVRFFEAVGNEMIRLSAIFYSMKRIGNLIGDVTIKPVEDILQATSLSRRFQGSIAGTVGGVQNAQAIDNSLISGLPGSPYTLEEARQSAQISARISALSPAFGLATPQGAAGQAQELADIIARLQIGSPEKTGEEIGKAVQGYLEGNTRSLRQLGIDPKDLQAISGLSQKELADNQQAELDALRTRSRQLVPDSVMSVRMNDPEFIVQRIHDLFTVAMQRVGDSGLYDEVGKKLQSAFEHIFGYVQSSDFLTRASQISSDLTSIVGSVVDAGATLLQAVSGSSNKAVTAKDVGDQLGQVVQSLANIAEALGVLAHGAGWVYRSAQGGAMNLAVGGATTALGGMNSVANTGAAGISTFEGAKMLAKEFFTSFGGDSEISDGQFGANSFTGNRDDAMMRATADLMRGRTFYATGPSTKPSNPDFASLLAQRYPTKDIDGMIALGDDPFASMFSGVNRSIGLLGPEADKTDKLGKVLEDGANALDLVFTKFKRTNDPNETPGDFFQKIYEYRNSKINELEDTRGGLLDITKHYKAGTAEHDISQGYLDKIDLLESRLSNLEPEVRAAIGRLNGGAGRYNLSYIDALKGEDPSVRAAEMDRVLSGNTDVGRRVTMANLGISDSMQQWFPWMGNLPEGVYRQFGGMGAILDQYQPAALQDQISAHMDAIKQQGKYDQYLQSNTLLFGQGVAGQQSSYLQSMLPEMQKQLASAQSSGNGLEVERLTADIARLRSEMDQLSMSSNAAMQSFLEFGKQATDAIENGLGNALYGLISGTEKASQAFRQMAQEILKSFTQMGVHAAFNSIGLNGSGNTGGAIGAIIKMFQGFGGGGDKMGNSPNLGGGPSVWSVGPTESAANGAVWIPSFASGGVARSPMILVGERSDGIPEAVVPMTAGGRIPMGFGPDGPHAILPSGQRIPGSFVGYAQGGILGNVGSGASGGGIHLHNYFVNSEEEANAHASSMSGLENHIINVVSRDLMKGGSTFRAVQRGGGR